MKLHNVKAVYCTETEKLLEFSISNRNNLSHKRKLEFKKLQKEINENKRKY